MCPCYFNLVKNFQVVLHGRYLFREWTTRMQHFCNDSGCPIKTRLVKDKAHLLIGWSPPDPAFVRINFDGSVSQSRAAGGFIIRDQSGCFLQAASLNFGTAGVLVAEASAMLRGIQSAIQLGYINLHVEGDNLIVIQALKDEIQVMWKIATIIWDAKQFLLQCPQHSISHLMREGNQAADWLANNGHNVSDVEFFSQPPSPSLSVILLGDLVGTTFPRKAS